MQHSQQCIRDFEKYNALLKEYSEKYPDYCKACNGFGYFESSYDPSPSGVALSSGSFTEIEYCLECVENNRCPRCFTLFDEDPEDFKKCVRCNFEIEKDAGIDKPECCCWEEQIEYDQHHCIAPTSAEILSDRERSRRYFE